MQEASAKETASTQPELVLIQKTNLLEKKSVFNFVTKKISNGLARVIRFVEVYQEKDE